MKPPAVPGRGTVRRRRFSTQPNAPMCRPFEWFSRMAASLRVAIEVSHASSRCEQVSSVSVRSRVSSAVGSPSSVCSAARYARSDARAASIEPGSASQGPSGWPPVTPASGMAKRCQCVSRPSVPGAI